MIDLIVHHNNLISSQHIDEFPVFVDQEILDQRDLVQRVLNYEFAVLVEDDDPFFVRGKKIDVFFSDSKSRAAVERWIDRFQAEIFLFSAQIFFQPAIIVQNIYITVDG